jgi:hypothetical protein
MKAKIKATEKLTAQLSGKGSDTNPVPPPPQPDNRLREEYLTGAIAVLNIWFKTNASREIPPVRVSCGWPYGTRAASKRKVGQCWDRSASKDGVAQIFISPAIDETMQAIGILAHELVHATVGVSEGHGGDFATLAKAVQMEGKMPECRPNDQFRLFIENNIVSRLGAYPHAAINIDDENREKVTGEKKDGTRMVKCHCPVSGYTCRTTRKWLDQFGPPISPKTRKPMETDIIPDAADTDGTGGAK